CYDWKPLAPVCRRHGLSLAEVSRAGCRFRAGGALDDRRRLAGLAGDRTEQEESEDSANDSLANHSGCNSGCFPKSDPSRGAAMVIAQLNDGAGQVALDGNGKLSGVDHLPPGYQQMIRNALSSQRLEKPPLLAGLVRPDALSMRGDDNQGNKFSVIAPVGIVMLYDRPTFRWSPLEGATGYVVEVYDAKRSQIITSPQLADTSWTAPQSLKRGGIYSWQVIAI